MTAPDQPAPEQPSPFPGRRPRLLVVDDQPLNIQALYQAFSADHQVFMAKSGEQALQMCDQQAPDLVLLDVMMPGMDGHEVCRRLKSKPATADIPVIFVTAHGDAAAEAEGLDVGAVDFITKPIHPKIVRARVRTHLTLKAQADMLRHWVYIDGLTQIHNRRHFDEQLSTEWARAERNGTALSLIMIDVDFFKRYNDRYGHQAGDDCLRQVAAALRGGLKRPGDLPARYGGEEFACLLPETALTGAVEVARALAERVQSLHIEHADSEAGAWVTISLGVCSKPANHAGMVQDLVREADAQLYIAKSRGRNQACGAELESG